MKAVIGGKSNIQVICGIEHIVITRWDGTRSWWLANRRTMCHREDGPAIERPNGTKSWFLYGEKVSKNHFDKYVAKRRLSKWKNIASQ
jgi:hypothetical protein